LKSKRRTDVAVTSKIGVAFIVPGIVSLLLSIYSESKVLAFLGLGLAFWGALFLFVRPSAHGRYAEGSPLNTTATASYLTIDRIIKDFKLKGKGYYIPPAPKGVYLPMHLEGLQDSVVFISAKNDAVLPSIEEMGEGKFLTKKPKGVLLVPPGLYLQTQIEKKLNVEKQIEMNPVLAPKIELRELCDVLPRVILEDFDLARDVVMALEEKQIILKIHDSVYQNLYDTDNGLKSIRILGCPILSAVASIIAKVAGKPVAIGKLNVSPDGSSIWAFFSIVEEQSK
jgi:hypothetical protein